jgi:hypothetical protein
MATAQAKYKGRASAVSEAMPALHRSRRHTAAEVISKSARND